MMDDSDRDLMIRTIIGEAGGESPAGQQAVANVVMNRLKSGDYGSSPAQIVTAPNQFTAWNDRPQELSNIDPKSPQYQQVGQIVDDVASGKLPDNTRGAVNYYSPSLQAAQGRKTPSFAQGVPAAVVGNHVFYGQPDDLLGQWGKPTQTAEPQYVPVSSGGGITVRVPVGNAPQQNPEDDLLGQWNVKPSQTTATQPPAPPPANETPAQATARMLSENLKTPGIEGIAARTGLGALRGVGDIADTIGEGIAGAGRYGANTLANVGVLSPQTATNVGNWADTVEGRITAARNAFDTAAANSPAAQVGRIGGEVVGSGPFIEAAPLRLAGLGPVERTLAQGALAGGASSALTSSASDEPFWQQVGTGTAAGATLGPLSYGASALGRGARNLVFGALDPETAGLARAAQGYGINVGPGQLSSTDIVRRADSLLQRFPFTGYGARAEEQQSAFNRAVSNTFGEDTDTITPQTIANAKQRIGQVFDDVAQRTGNIQVDQGFVNDIRNIVQDAQVHPDNVVQGVERQLRNVISTIDPNTGTIDADAYQALTRKGAPLDLAQKGSERTTAYYANQIRDALDDVMQRSAPPDAAQDLQEARRQWKALKTVEPLAKKAPTGDISPALLLGKANTSYTYGNGGQLGELGRIGQRFLKPMGTSGTAEHLALMKLGGAAIGGAIGLGGAYEFDPENFQRNALLGLSAFALGRAGSRILRSQALTNGMIRGGLGAPIAAPSPAFLSRAAPVGALTYRQANGLPGQ